MHLNFNAKDSSVATRMKLLAVLKIILCALQRRTFPNDKIYEPEAFFLLLPVLPDQCQLCESVTDGSASGTRGGILETH